MKKIVILFTLFVMVIGAGVVSADVGDNPNHFVLTITCEDGYSGDVIIPADGAKAGFFNGGIDGLGLPRGITVTAPDGTVVFQDSQPGEGYVTVVCSFTDPDGFLIELDIQRVNPGD